MHRNLSGRQCCVKRLALLKYIVEYLLRITFKSTRFTVALLVLSLSLQCNVWLYSDELKLISGKEFLFVCFFFFSVPQSSNCAHVLTSITGFLPVFLVFLSLCQDVLVTETIVCLICKIEMAQYDVSQVPIYTNNMGRGWWTYSYWTSRRTCFPLCFSLYWFTTRAYPGKRLHSKRKEKKRQTFSTPCSKDALNLKRSGLPREALTKTFKAKLVARLLALG